MKKEVIATSSKLGIATSEAPETKEMKTAYS